MNKFPSKIYYTELLKSLMDEHCAYDSSLRCLINSNKFLNQSIILSKNSNILPKKPPLTLSTLLRLVDAKELPIGTPPILLVVLSKVLMLSLISIDSLA